MADERSWTPAPLHCQAKHCVQWLAHKIAVTSSPLANREQIPVVGYVWSESLLPSLDAPLRLFFWCCLPRPLRSSTRLLPSRPTLPFFHSSPPPSGLASVKRRACSVPVAPLRPRRTRWRPPTGRGRRRGCARLSSISSRRTVTSWSSRPRWYVEGCDCWVDQLVWELSTYAAAGAAADALLPGWRGRSQFEVSPPVTLSARSCAESRASYAGGSAFLCSNRRTFSFCSDF